LASRHDPQKGNCAPHGDRIAAEKKRKGAPRTESAAPIELVSFLKREKRNGHVFSHINAVTREKKKRRHPINFLVIEKERFQGEGGSTGHLAPFTVKKGGGEWAFS